MGANDLDPSTDPPLDVWASGTAEGALAYSSPSQGLQSRVVLSATGGDASNGQYMQLVSSTSAGMWYPQHVGAGDSSVMPIVPGPQPWYTLNVSSAGAALSNSTHPQPMQAPWTVAPAAVAGSPGTQVLQVVIPCPATPSPVTQQLVCLPDGTLITVPPSPQLPQQQPQVIYVIQSPTQQQQQQQQLQQQHHHQQQQQQVVYVVNSSTPNDPSGGSIHGGVQMVQAQAGALGQQQGMPIMIPQPAAAAPNGAQSWIMLDQQQQQQQPIVLMVSSPGHSPDLSTAMHGLGLDTSSSSSSSQASTAGAASSNSCRTVIQQVVMEPPGLEAATTQPQVVTGGVHILLADGSLVLQGQGQPPASIPRAAASHLGYTGEATGDDAGADSSSSPAAGAGSKSSKECTALGGPQAGATFQVMPLEAGPAAVLGGASWGELLVARGALVVLLETTWGVLTWTHFGAWAAAVCKQCSVTRPASEDASTPRPAAESGGKGQEAAGGSMGGPAAGQGPTPWSLTPPAGVDLVKAVNTPQLLQLLQSWRSAIWTLTHTVAAARRALPSAAWARDLRQVLCAADASMAFSCPWDVAETILPQGLARALQLPPPRQSSMSRPPAPPPAKGPDSSTSSSSHGTGAAASEPLRWEQLPQSFNSALAASHYARNVSLPGLQALVTSGCLPPQPQLVQGAAPQWREMALQARLDYRQLKLPFPSRVVPSPLQQPTNAYGPPPRPAYAPAPKRPVTY